MNETDAEAWDHPAVVVNWVPNSMNLLHITSTRTI
jgi:hypothetical protein